MIKLFVAVYIPTVYRKITPSTSDFHIDVIPN